MDFPEGFELPKAFPGSMDFPEGFELPKAFPGSMDFPEGFELPKAFPGSMDFPVGSGSNGIPYNGKCGARFGVKSTCRSGLECQGFVGTTSPENPAGIVQSGTCRPSM